MTDPLVMDLVGTVAACAALVGAGALALWLLPWREREDERLERSAEAVWNAITQKAQRLVVPVPWRDVA
jgi:hypothetical protein